MSDQQEVSYSVKKDKKSVLCCNALFKRLFGFSRPQLPAVNFMQLQPYHSLLIRSKSQHLSTNTKARITGLFDQKKKTGLFTGHD